MSAASSAALSISARRLRVTLEAPVDVPDDIGGLARSWQPVIALWARLTPERGQERAEAQRAEGAVSHRLTIRFGTPVTPAMRFAVGETIYQIHAVFDPDGRRRNLVCLVEEVQR